MGTIIVLPVNGIESFVDTDFPGVAIDATSALDEGSKPYMDVAAFISNNPQLHNITDAGSGQIITIPERTGLHGHSNLPVLEQLASPTGAEINFVLTATAAGLYSWQLVTIADPNHRGVHADLAALIIAIPTGQDGNYAILLNGANPASFGVWDSTEWIDTLASTGVLSVNGDVGPAVTFDSDDIAQGTTNLFLTGAERAEIANVPIQASAIQANTVNIATNVTDIGLRLTTVDWQTSVAFGLTDLGSARVITVGERTALSDIANYLSPQIFPGTPEIGKVWTAISDVLSGWVTAATGSGTVSSVNNELPDGGGNVVLTTLNIATAGSSLYISQAQLDNITTNQNSAAANATAIARITANVALTQSAALAFDTSTGLNSTVTLIQNTKPALLTGVSAGENATQVIMQDTSGTHHMDFENFKGNPRINKEAGSITVLDYKIASVSEQHVSVRDSGGTGTQRAIRYPKLSGGIHNSIGGGATSVWDNVEGGSPPWLWEDVRKYQFMFSTDLTVAGPYLPIRFKEKWAQCVQNAPNTLILSDVRQDIWQCFDDFEGVRFADQLWGSLNFKRPDGTVIEKPTFAMGEPPDDGKAWSLSQDDIETTATPYVQLTQNSQITNGGLLLSNPYQIALDATAREWWVNANQMNVADLAWLELYTDALVANRKIESSIAGYYIAPNKIQRYKSTFSYARQLHAWIENIGQTGDNPGWVLETNLGGSPNTWVNNEEAYDDRNATRRSVDIVESCLYLAIMLKAKDPAAFILFSPFSLVIDSWRDSTIRTDFQASARAKYPSNFTPFGFGTITSDAEADEYWESIINQTAARCDAIEFPMDDDLADFSTEWAHEMRSHRNVVQWSQKPQDISNLADQ